MRMKYTMTGKVTIPEEKRDNLNYLVLCLLWYGGIRKTDTIEYYDDDDDDYDDDEYDSYEYDVTKAALPDKNGIVSFDYSLYDNCSHSVATYDMNTCELKVESCYFDCYGVVMSAIMALQICLSTTECNFYLGDREASVEKHLKFVGGILLKRMEFHTDETDMPIYELLRLPNEDSLLEIWDGENLVLSDEMYSHFKAWKECYDRIDVPDDMDMEKELHELLWRMQHVWQCQYAPLSFVNEFHRENDEVHRKLLLVMKEFMDKKSRLFPEMTHGDWKCYIETLFDHSDEVEYLQAYMSLMVNHEQRDRIFGIGE